MARQEHTREDLLRDAKALVPRIQITLSDEPTADPIVCGFRGDAASVYFGEDPAYHFNPAGRLRRAFVGGELLKADEGALVAMRRERSATEVALASRRLAPAETEALLADATERLGRVAAALAAGRFTIEGQEPPQGDALARFASLAPSLLPLRIANVPNVAGA
ncbi:MAG: hypothetical protein KF847_05615 [Pirellulales bacterium]|nr:hypothetical protein [Pirellulales bacterium]